MGFYAVAKTQRNYASASLIDEDLDHAFKMASQKLIDRFAVVDGALFMGMLNSHDSAEILEQVTGQDVYDVDEWSKEDVKRFAKLANWDYSEHAERKTETVRAFLKICSDNNLAIEFR